MFSVYLRPRSIRQNPRGFRGSPPPVLFALVLALLPGLCGCRRGQHGAVNIVGSTSIQPFAEMLAQDYEKGHPGTAVDIQGGGSTAGLQAVAEGIAEIGTCSRSLKSEETGFTPIVIAQDGLAIVVHPKNSIRGLSRSQILDIFSGKTTDWRDVSGPNLPIRLITREEGSGTREAFVKLLMGDSRISRKALTQESNGAVKELVKHDPCAIGYMSFGLVGDELKIIEVDGVKASSETVANGAYALRRPFLFVLKGTPRKEAQDFIDFVLSAEAKAILEKEGLAAGLASP